MELQDVEGTGPSGHALMEEDTLAKKEAGEGQQRERNFTSIPI